MHRRSLLKAMGALALCPLCATAGSAAEGPHWSYEGESGPDKWGSLGGDGNVCSTGTQQSPVDITGTIRADVPRLGIAWTKRPETIVNNGHTIQLNFPEGGTLRVGNDVYKLVQFHFHHPSEHLINGKGTAMEVHFVHAAPSGGYGVVGVMMKAGPAQRVVCQDRRHHADPGRPAREGRPGDRSERAACRSGAAISAMPARSPPRPAARPWPGWCSATRSRSRAPTSSGSPSCSPTTRGRCRS